MSREKINVWIVRILQIGIVVLLMLGFFHVEDYGISFDEGTEFNTTILTFQYAEVMLNRLFGENVVDTTGFMEYPDNIYGAAIRYPLYLIACYLPMSVRSFFLVSHHYTYLWFCGAVAALYYLLKELTGKREMACLGALLFIFSPRIAAESFYNIKDSLFMSIFLINMAAGYFFLKQRKTSGLVLFSFFSALCINTRYIGGILLLVVVGIYVMRLLAEGKKTVKSLLTGLGICFFTYGFYYVMTPFLWTNPLVNTWKIIASFSDYSDGVMDMLFCGTHYTSDQIPWYYLIVWIGISTPILILLLFLWETVRLGFEFVKKSKSRKESLEWKSILLQNDSYYYGAVTMLFMVLLLDILLKPIKYDGWRHFYFLYPLIIIMATMGIHKLWMILEKQENKKIYVGGKIICLVAIVASMGTTFLWGVKNHPYEYLYFNSLAGIETENFERDYWYVSTYDAMQEVLAMQPEGSIKVYCVCKTVSLFLEEEDLARVEFVDAIGDAEFVILQYRNATVEELKQLCIGMELLSEKTVDGLPIYSIYYAQ